MVTHNSVEVNHRVEMARRANPFIDDLSVGFTQWTGMIIIRACIRSDGRADHYNAVRVSSGKDLFVGCNNPPRTPCVFRLGYFTSPCKAAKIVHSLKNDQPVHTRLGEDVPVKACQRVRTQPVGQEMIAPDSLV